MGRPLILLEFDDVVVASRDARRDALRQAAAFDNVIFGDAFFDERCAGLSFDEAARAAYSASPLAADETAIELTSVRAGRNYAAVAARGTLLAPGVGEFLRHQAGTARLGLVAAAPAAEVTRLLELADLADSFESVFCDDDGVGDRSLAALWSRARARLLRRDSGSNAEVVAVVAVVASANAFNAAQTAGCRATFAAACQESLAQ